MEKAAAANASGSLNHESGDEDSISDAESSKPSSAIACVGAGNAPRTSLPEQERPRLARHVSDSAAIQPPSLPSSTGIISMCG